VEGFAGRDFGRGDALWRGQGREGGTAGAEEYTTVKLVSHLTFIDMYKSALDYTSRSDH
jgi:hypothetical protein